MRLVVHAEKAGEGMASKVWMWMKSDGRKYLTVIILTFINLINYTDRYTIAGRGTPCMVSTRGWSTSPHQLGYSKCTPPTDDKTSRPP